MGIPEATESGQIDEDIPCASCGYNLRTLHQDAKCPECGVLVWDSLFRHRLRIQKGLKPLDRSDPIWLAGIFEGACLIVVALVLFLVQAWALSETYDWVDFEAVLLGMMCSIWVLCWYAGWKFSVPERESTGNLRRVFYRGCNNVYFGFVLLFAVADYLGDSALLLGLVITLAGLFGSVFHFLLISHFARRLQCLWIELIALFLVVGHPIMFVIVGSSSFGQRNGLLGILLSWPTIPLNAPLVPGRMFRDVIQLPSVFAVIILAYFLLVAVVHITLCLKFRKALACVRSKQGLLEQPQPSLP